MATTPPDQSANIQKLAEAVDKLSGQVSALMAYVAYLTDTPFDENTVSAIQGKAQLTAPAQIANLLAGKHPPGFYASKAVEEIQETVKSKK